MPEYRLKTPALARKVVGLYRKIEQGTVLAYKKIEDRFVDAFLEKVENAAQKEDEEAQADAGTRDSIAAELHTLPLHLPFLPCMIKKS